MGSWGKLWTRQHKKTTKFNCHFWRAGRKTRCWEQNQVSCMPPTAAGAKSFQSFLTLCDHIDGSPPGSPIPRILQEWVAISFSNAWKWKVKVKSLSRVRLLVTSWTAAYQAPPSMGFSRQEWVPPALTTKGMGQPPKPPLCPDPWISQSGE